MVARSSAEAELTGLCRGGSAAIGLQSLCADLGLKMGLRLHSDSTAASGVCRRRGLGRIRHQAVVGLLLQDEVRTGKLTLNKALGKDNPADRLTKHVDHQTMVTQSEKLGLTSEAGRSESVPTVAD